MALKLLEYGAGTEVTTDRGLTALHFLCQAIPTKEEEDGKKTWNQKKKKQCCWNFD